MRLTLRLSDGLPPLRCDASQIQQVVVNLLMNALEASRTGGVVEVSTESVPAEAAVELVVSDSGVGIPEKNLARIYEPFFSTKGEGKGVGLGLAVVYGIVNGHGAAIDVSSTLGEGTTFRIRFPLSSRARSRESVGRGADGGTPMKNQWHILVVDDEAVMRESLVAWLQEDGYVVDTAASGREAVAKAALKDYVAYCVDLKMPPGIDGIETMTEIRKIRPDAAVLIITAYATVDTAITAMKEGAIDYLVKPCNPREISLVMERLIRVKTIERENQVLRHKLTGQYAFQNIVSRNSRMLALLETVRNVAGYRLDGPDSRRERDGQGALREGAPPVRGSGGGTVRRGLVRRAHRDATRVRVVRLREGGVYRRAGAPPRQVRAGGWRHAVSR